VEDDGAVQKSKLGVETQGRQTVGFGRGAALGSRFSAGMDARCCLGQRGLKRAEKIGSQISAIPAGDLVGGVKRRSLAKMEFRGDTSRWLDLNRSNLKPGGKQREALGVWAAFVGGDPPADPTDSLTLPWKEDHLRRWATRGCRLPTRRHVSAAALFRCFLASGCKLCCNAVCVYSVLTSTDATTSLNISVKIVTVTVTHTCLTRLL
jgi:hypothetical protein